MKNKNDCPQSTHSVFINVTHSESAVVQHVSAFIKALIGESIELIFHNP